MIPSQSTDDLVKRLRDLAMDAATRKDHDTGGKIWLAADTIERLQRENEEQAKTLEAMRDTLERIMHARRNPKVALTDMSRAGMRELAGETLAAIDAARSELRAYRDPKWRLVPVSALNWLNGEGEDFECPPELYFRGKEPRYWWRTVFRRMLAASPDPLQKKP